MIKETELVVGGAHTLTLQASFGFGILFAEMEVSLWERSSNHHLKVSLPHILSAFQPHQSISLLSTIKWFIFHCLEHRHANRWSVGYFCKFLSFYCNTFILKYTAYVGWTGSRLKQHSQNWQDSQTVPLSFILPNPYTYILFPLVIFGYLLCPSTFI